MRWRIIPGFEYYEASDTGIIRRAKAGGSPIARKGRIIKPHACGRHRLKVQLFDGNGAYKWMTVQRVVLLAFKGPPPTPQHQCAHYDGNQNNNNIKNLRWATPKENGTDKLRHGTQARGYNAGPKKFKPKDIRKMRRLYARGMSQEKIAKLMGTSQSHARRIVRNLLWKWVK